ncbi:hypothetical protein [Frankia sp. R43]|uniref:hypothetical protein n=1 Tax=Frankia sp. R43 TaxID=269536 RepID=UPI0007C6EEB6|nr:hypothetical protein [Frankia sp. R43]
MTEPTRTGGHKTLAVKLPPDLHAQLELVSGLDGLSMGAALLQSVELYVQTRRSQPDFAERAAAAVAEAEAEAAARRSAIQALLGGGVPAQTDGSEPVGAAHGAVSVPRRTKGS